MTFTVHREPEKEINGETGTITGTALYDYRIEPCFDADIGGTDGPDVTHCEFLGIEIDGALIPAETITHIIGAASVSDMEAEASRVILLNELERDAA